MNKIYKIIWSKTRNCYVAVSEIAKRNGKSCTSVNCGGKAKGNRAVLALALALSVTGGAVFTTPQAAMAADIVITSGSETINDATHAADDYYLDGSNITFTVNEGGVVNSISGHGDAAVSGNTVTINGGTVNHADTDWTEPSSGSGDWVGKPNLTGGFSTSGAVIGNQVSITNATLIGDYPAAYGGYSQTGNVSKNSITFEGGDNQELYINGGFSATGVAGGDTAADGNIVTIKSGTFFFVAGGYSERGSAKNNQVSVSGGTVNTEVYGGYVGGGTGEATNNKVEISGGTVGSSVYGGYSYTGTAEGNNVNVTGGHITVSVYGGKTYYGDSTNNTGAVIKNIVSVSGSGTQIDGEIYGGNSTYGKVDGNKVTISNGKLLNVIGGASTSDVVNNEVTITGGNMNNIYGGYIGNGTGKAEGNKVIISSGTVTKGVYGGYVNDGTGTAGYNSVEISDGTVGASAFGGFSMNGAAEGNTVTMTGGTASGVIGGRSIRGSATGNTVDISQSSTDIETKITGEVYGGSVSSGSGAANNNTVTMTGVTAGNVYGGWARPDGAAINNKIKLENARVGYVYGGSSQGGEISKNSVTISKGQVSGVIGGTTIYGEVTENEVELDGVSSDFEILGGTSQYGNTTENSVKLSNSTVNHKIHGGVSIRKDASRNTVTLSDSTAERDIYGGYSNLGNVEENEVTIKGGTVKEKVYGGSTGGNANGNTVTISDGAAVKDNIYGGYSSGDCYYMDSTGNTPSTADGNTINISGSPDLSESEICGGSAYTSAQNNTINILSPVTVKGLTGGIKQTTGTVAGNALNVAAKNVTAGSVNGFQNMNFYLPSDIANNDTMLTVNGGSATDVKDVTFGVAALSGVNLQKGDTVNLLFNSNGLTAEDELKTADSSQLGSASFLTPNNLATDTKYELSISKKDGNTIITTVENVEGAPEPEPEPEPEPTPEPDYSGNERLKSLVETRAAMETMLNAGTDLLTGQGMDNAAYAAGDRDAGGGFNMFAAVGISKLRAKSGSHVDIKGIGLNLGLAREIENSSGKLLFAPVIEYGHGSYDSYQDNGIKADGNTSYWGLGLIAKQTNDNGFYYEGSIRGGRVKSDYDSDFSTATHASYDSAATYWAAHAGIGKLTDLGKDNTLDVYGKYFYSHTGSDSVTVHATGGDENVNFSSVNSHRARLGARLIHAINEKNKLYGGLAYQYEFSGEARATYNGGSTPSPSVKGSSGLIELGWQVKPGKGPMSVDFGVTGWVGKQRGVTANLLACWTF